MSSAGSSFAGSTFAGGGSMGGSAWRPASSGINGRVTSGAAHADRMRRMRIMYGVGGDPEARFPRKIEHTPPSHDSAASEQRWARGNRFDFLDPDLRTSLTEWPQFDAVDQLLRSRAKKRVELEFLAHRMEQLGCASVDKTQAGQEVFQYFSMGGISFACVVMDDSPRQPGVVQFVRHFYVESLTTEQHIEVERRQDEERMHQDATARADEHRMMTVRMQEMELDRIDQEEKEREERLMAQAAMQAAVEQQRAYASLHAPPDLNGIKRRVRAVVRARFGDGMKGIRRFFDSINNDRSGKWDIHDMRDGLREYGVSFSEPELRAFCSYLDTSGMHKVTFENFFVFIKGELSAARRPLVHEAFAKIDHDRDGLINLADMRAQHDASLNPDVLNGSTTAEQVFTDIVAALRTRFSTQGDRVTLQEFEDYYGWIGATVEDDAFFALQLKRSWRGH